MRADAEKDFVLQLGKVRYSFNRIMFIAGQHALIISLS
jgi:hypothetical protein